MKLSRNTLEMLLWMLWLYMAVFTGVALLLHQYRICGAGLVGLAVITVYTIIVCRKE